MTAKVLRRAELNRKFAALPQIAKDEIRKALARSAGEIAAFARSLVPVDSGALRDSIGWTYGAAPKGSMTLASAAVGELTVTVFAGNSEAYYARWVEFGTQKMTAQPYFFPAYRALRKRARSRVSRATTAAAKKVAAR